jgi:hypothetical protein
MSSNLTRPATFWSNMEPAGRRPLLELSFGLLSLVEQSHIEPVHLDGDMPVLKQTLGHVDDDSTIAD